MVKFEKLFISFMILGLLIFGMLAFIVLMQDENSIGDKFIDNPLINNTYSGLETDLTGFRSKAQSQKTLFESENPTGGFGTILLFSIVSVGKVFNGMIMGVFNSLIKLPVVFLGLDPIIVAVLSTMLILIILLGLWAVYKLGG